MSRQVVKSSSLRSRVCRVRPERQRRRGRVNNTVRTWFAILTVTVLADGSTAQNAPALTDASAVSVITILPGDPLYSSFGHTAIRVRDDSTGIDVGYNYGTFDFDEEGFYLKFLRGKLDYVLARNPFDDVLYGYELEQRPVIEQVLNLSLEERQDLFDRIERNYLPENRAYRYEFLYDNCSTRPRDVIEAAWGYRMGGGSFSSEETFRNLIDAYLADKPWTRFGIDLLLGAPTDIVAAPRERMFLPDEFLAGVDDARSQDGARLAQPPDTLYWAPGYVRWHGALPWPAIVGWTLLFIVGALTLLFSDRAVAATLLRRFDGVFFSLIGLLGLLVVFMWFATEHTLTQSNWNLLWALPTHAILGMTLLRGRRPSWLVPYLWITLALVGLTVVGWRWIPQEFSPWLAPFIGLVLVRTAFNIRTAHS